MIQPIILAKGKFKPEDIKVTVGLSNRKIDPKIESQIEALWKIKEGKAKKNGQLIYNGLSYRLNSLDEKDGKLFLDLGVFDFKTRECLMEVPGYFDLNQEYWRKGCHTLATVKTSDNKYVMVGLSGKSMNANKTDFLGGIMETEPSIKTSKDIFETLYKELKEEAFINRDDIKELDLKLIYINSKTNAGFYFEMILDISSEDLQKNFDANIKEIDIKNLVIMSRDEYINALKNHNENKQFLATQIEI